MDEKMNKNRNTFSLLCYIKKTKLLRNGEAPVFIRLTVNKQKVDLSISGSVKAQLWSQTKEQSRGKEKADYELNHFIKSVKAKLINIHRELELSDKPISALIIKEIYLGCNTDEDNKTLDEVHSDHNERCRKLLGIEYSKSTIYKFDTSLKYLVEFMNKEMDIKDIPLNKINEDFIRKYELYLKTEKGCQQNTVIRYMKCFKKITNLALANDWITKDPFVGIKFQEKEVIKEILTKEESTILMQKEFAIERLELVRDVFIFCCFTGLAFVDASQLRPEHIVKDNKGEFWIRKARQKTKNMCNIPLLEIPQILIDKYKDHPEANKKGLCLPVPANQKMNSYLKEIANLCGINKAVTTHQARHSISPSVL